MKQTLLYIWLLAISFALHAQEPGGLKPGTDTAAINLMLARSHKILNPDTAIVCYNDILAISKAANYVDGAFIALITKGIKYYEKEDYENYREYTRQAIPWARRSTQKDALAWCYVNIGEAYLCEGDYTTASEYYYLALDEVKKLPVTHTTVNVYNSLGQVNLRLGQAEKAMYYFNTAEDMSRREKLYYQLAMTYTYKGQHYTDIHKPDSARKYFNGVMDIGVQIGKVDLRAMANADLGKTYISEGEYNKAVSFLRSAIALAQNRFPYIVVDASYSLGDAWYHLHKYGEAEAILDTALHEIISHNYRDYYITCYNKLIDVYKATGQYKKAMDYMDTVAVLKEALTSAEKARAINQMEIKYKTAEKDKVIAQNGLVIAQQNNTLTRKNFWIAGTAGSILLLLFAAVGFYNRLRTRQRLQAGQIKTLQQENTISILKGVVQGEENERTRIARELHDGIGGMLSAAMMRFMTIRHENPAITQSNAYREAMDTLTEMGDEIRKTAHNLMPEVLLKQSLPEAVQSYCNSMQVRDSLQIDFQSFGDFSDIMQEFKLSAYRIVQELLKNIQKHAKASHALVELQMHDQTLTITVEDNGTGFDTTGVKSGMGLKNLDTRIRSFDGHYTIESDPGKGTSVYIEFEKQKTTAI